MSAAREIGVTPELLALWSEVRELSAADRRKLRDWLAALERKTPAPRLAGEVNVR